jgi:hypothetical protein
MMSRLLQIATRPPTTLTWMTSSSIFRYDQSIVPITLRSGSCKGFVLLNGYIFFKPNVLSNEKDVWSDLVARN